MIHCIKQIILYKHIYLIIWIFDNVNYTQAILWVCNNLSWLKLGAWEIKWLIQFPEACITLYSDCDCQSMVCSKFYCAASAACCFTLHIIEYCSKDPLKYQIWSSTLMETIYLILTRDDLTNVTEINILIIKALILIMNTCTKWLLSFQYNYFTKHSNLSQSEYDAKFLYILLYNN